MGYLKFSIPPRSPDLNPIENIFHLVGKKRKKDGRVELGKGAATKRVGPSKLKDP